MTNILTLLLPISFRGGHRACMYTTRSPRDRSMYRFDRAVCKDAFRRNSRSQSSRGLFKKLSQETQVSCLLYRFFVRSFGMYNDTQRATGFPVHVRMRNPFVFVTTMCKGVYSSAVSRHPTRPPLESLAYRLQNGRSRVLHLHHHTIMCHGGPAIESNSRLCAVHAPSTFVLCLLISGACLAEAFRVCQFLHVPNW